MFNRRPEILAPAGSIESAKAAFNAGADAVYIGGPKFGARAYADNPDMNLLKDLLDYAHVRNKRIYLTVNTLLKQNEIEQELFEYISEQYRNGIDAVIVQDYGVASFISKYFKSLPIHLSTQMTIVSADALKLFDGMNVTRVVPARELSLEEIKTLRNSTDLEIETFVHGAMCYSYSGQCLMSSMIGDRSGNRGRCAQPCRMQYSLCMGDKRFNGGKYVLSMKDMNTLKILPDLIDAGIDSFKIEGRMKKPEYSACVVNAYRKVTDLYCSLGREQYRRYVDSNPDFLKKLLTDTADIYNRGGACSGYYFQYHGNSMMSEKRQNHFGVLVGKVVGFKGIVADIEICEKIGPQDVLEIRRDGKELYEFTIGKAYNGGKKLSTNVKPGTPVKVGDRVYRIKNESLIEELTESFISKNEKVSINGKFKAKKGQKMSFTVNFISNDGKNAEITVYSDEAVSEAKNRPSDEESVRKNLMATGESDVRFEELETDIDKDVFLPVGVVKDLRRRAIERLLLEAKKLFYRDEVDFAECKKIKETGLNISPEVICLVSNMEQMKTVLGKSFVDAVYDDMQNEGLDNLKERAAACHEFGKKYYYVFPRIFRNKEKEFFKKEKTKILEADVDGYVACSSEEIVFIKEELDGKPIRANYSLYVANSYGKEFLLKHGVERFTALLEENVKELQMVGVSGADLLVYGRMPLMVSAECLADNFFKCEKGKNTDNITLTDKMAAVFPVRRVCTSCYNVIYNSVCYSLEGFEEEIKKLAPGGIRFDFTFENKQEVLEVLGNGDFVSRRSNLEKKSTKGHFLKSIL